MPRGVYPRPSAEDRFWKYVDQSDGCWIWQRAASASGYGIIRLAGRCIGTHVLAWILRTGLPVPKGFAVLHTCDVPLCTRNDDEGIYEVNGIVRPRFGHLFLGTTADNTADMVAKGRHAHGNTSAARLHPELRRGERNGRAKLNDAAIVAIRADPRGARELAGQYGVHEATIRYIRSGKLWRHIT